jgi:hypothetical protein
MQSWMALTVAVLFLGATSLVYADDSPYMAPARNGDDVTAESILADGFIVRPAGIVATIFGSVAFVLTLPFSIPTKSVDKAAQKLVVDPARYTFVRPLGQIESPRPQSR